MGEELRKNQRVPQDMTTVLDGTLTDLQPVKLHIENLSAGGVGFESKHRFYTGEIVEFDLPLAIPVHAKAQVVWSETQGETIKYGAMFKGLEPHERRVLRSYLHLQMNALGLEPLPDDLG